MRVRRVYLAEWLRPASGARFYPDDRIRHYLFHVLRLRPGDRVLLFNRQGQWECQLAGGADDGLDVVKEHAVDESAALLISYLLPLLKGSRFRDAVRMLVEAGVDQILPVMFERSVRRPDNLQRLGDEITEWAGQAAQQCGTAPPVILQPVGSVLEMLERVEPESFRLLLSPAAEQYMDEQVAGDVKAVTLLSGPEGGLTEKEIDQLLRAGFLNTRLRTPTLRAETAPVVAVALVRHLAVRTDCG